MSNEQPESAAPPANTQKSTAGAEAQNTTGPVTTPTLTTKSAKNPKRVDAGKPVAERTRLHRETQKKALAEANIKIANEKEIEAKNKAKKADVGVPPQEDEPPPQQQQGLTTGQCIAIAGMGTTLLTAYVKREDVKALYKRWSTTTQQQPENPQPSQQPQPRHRVPPPVPKSRNAFRPMD